MGCDCIVRLPPNVRVRDVANVIAILSGCEKKWHIHDEDCKWIEVVGVSVEGSAHSPGCVSISISIPENSVAYKVRGNDSRVHCLFQYESQGMFYLSGRANSYWQAIGMALVDFFGGRVDFNDCDETEVDYKMRNKPNSENCPEDGKAWDVFQKRLFKLQPLTADDFDL